MNRQGNRRTTKEGSADLKFQNFALPINRSSPHLPHLSGIPGQYQTIKKPPRDDEKGFAAALDGAKGHRDNAYEDPECQMADTWPLVKFLPARPIKESEYADTRYFKGVMDPSILPNVKTSIPTEGQAWNPWTRLEEVDNPVSKDIRSQHVKGNRAMKANKAPLLPPRPPATLPKKYQPLSPEPVNHRPCSQPHTFPEVQGGPRQISLKDLSEVLRAEKAFRHQVTPQSSQLSQNQAMQEISLGIPSPSFMVSSHSVQNRDPTGSTQSSSPQRCQSPAGYGPHKNKLPCEPPGWRRPCPTPPDHKGIQHSEWYIGQYGRRVVEEALMKENKDGTFLVRDCSTKSKEEPYVLVVFYGNKVYNVKIRFLERNQQFALGTGLRGDERFDSVEDIIQHYKSFPIVLIDGKDKTGEHREQCCLTQPLPLNRHFSPW
ncbi:cytokine-dependent hematopoietic cell linker [Oryctolagus cuniculus]|uniref:Cytokine dependent hematopoietic cell linker n=1 Tax=Oryctolagus cuniculus TaxID=9986 RepID=G1SJH2_RABIT